MTALEQELGPDPIDEEDASGVETASEMEEFVLGSLRAQRWLEVADV